jgi:phosphoglycolate phosphatase
VRADNVDGPPAMAPANRPPGPYNSPMPILLFDIDGTLVRTGGAGKAAMEAALRERFGVSTIYDTVPYSGRTDPAIAADLLAAHGLDPADAPALTAAYLDRLPRYLQPGVGTVCPGVAELVTDLAGRTGVTLGLLTGNTRRGAERKLGHYALWEPFRFGGFGDDRTCRNDVARAAVAAAESHLGRPVDPREVWVIGDTPLDVSCARAVGAKVVAVGTGWHPLDELHATGADLVLPDLSDRHTLPAEWFP